MSSWAFDHRVCDYMAAMMGRYKFRSRSSPGSHTAPPRVLS